MKENHSDGLFERDSQWMGSQNTTKPSNWIFYTTNKAIKHSACSRIFSFLTQTCSFQWTHFCTLSGVNVKFAFWTMFVTAHTTILTCLWTMFVACVWGCTPMIGTFACTNVNQPIRNEERHYHAHTNSFWYFLLEMNYNFKLKGCTNSARGKLNVNVTFAYSGYFYTPCSKNVLNFFSTLSANL